MTPGHGDLQHQGRRGQDVGRGQPRLPRRRGRARARCCGTSTRRARHVPVPHQAEGQGRRREARARQERRRRAAQGHRPRAPRPAAGRLLLPPHGPRARRDQAADAAAWRACSRRSPTTTTTSSSTARRRSRWRPRACSRPPTSCSCRSSRRRCRSRTYDQLQRFVADEVPKPRPRILAFFSMVDGRKTLHRDIVEELAASDGVLASAIPAASDVERMGLQRRRSRSSPRTAARRARTARCGTELRVRRCRTRSSRSSRPNAARAWAKAVGSRLIRKRWLAAVSTRVQLEGELAGIGAVAAPSAAIASPARRSDARSPARAPRARVPRGWRTPSRR